MSNLGLTILLLAEGVITIITFSFFWKVLKTPPRKEPDSFSGNDGEKR